MINIPKNRNVKHYRDVQNVITSVILRQKGFFSKEDIYTKVEENLKFSPFGKYGKKRKEIDIIKMVDDTMNALWTTNRVKYDYHEEKYKLSMSFPAI